MQQCFLIDGEELYLEQVLIDYNDIPIFYICKSPQNHFVILCTDVEDVRYIIVKTSLHDVSKMLHGKLAMRDIITKQTVFWEVFPGDSIQDDIVERKDMSEMKKDELPYEDACYCVATEEMKEYLEKIDNKLYTGAYNMVWDISIEENGFDEIFQQDISDLFKHFQVNIQEYIEIYENALKTKLGQTTKDMENYKNDDYQIENRKEKTNIFSEKISNSHDTVMEENVFWAA